MHVWRYVGFLIGIGIRRLINNVCEAVVSQSQQFSLLLLVAVIIVIIIIIIVIILVLICVPCYLIIPTRR